MTRLQTAIATALAAASILGAAATAHGQQKEWTDTVTYCLGGTIETLSTAKDALMGTWHVSGVGMASDTTSPLHAASVECFGVFHVVAGATHQSDRCVIVDREGDRAWMVGRRVGDDSTIETIGGTGKYVGATGTSRRQHNVAKQTRAGLLQGCVTTTGTLTLK